MTAGTHTAAASPEQELSTFLRIRDQNPSLGFIYLCQEDKRLLCATAQWFHALICLWEKLHLTEGNSNICTTLCQISVWKLNCSGQSLWTAQRNRGAHPGAAQHRSQIAWESQNPLGWKRAPRPWSSTCVCSFSLLFKRERAVKWNLPHAVRMQKSSESLSHMDSELSSKEIKNYPLKLFLLCFQRNWSSSRGLALPNSSQCCWGKVNTQL